MRNVDGGVGGSCLKLGKHPRYHLSEAFGFVDPPSVLQNLNKYFLYCPGFFQGCKSGGVGSAGIISEVVSLVDLYGSRLELQ